MIVFFLSIKSLLIDEDPYVPIQTTQRYRSQHIIIQQIQNFLSEIIQGY